MKAISVKRYRISVSRIFPTTHPRNGEPTGFREKIYNAIFEKEGDWSTAPGPVSHYVFEPDFSIREKKFHTIRSNYDLWAKRMAEVQAGRAVIELFFWSGSPYNSKRDGSKQIVFATLDKDSGCGVQMYHIAEYEDDNGEERACYCIDNRMKVGFRLSELAKNDGLSVADFKAWFKGADLSEPLAIIHFTSFRY